MSLPWTGALPIDQVAHSLIQAGFKHSQEWGIDNFSGNLFQCLPTLTVKNFFLMSNLSVNVSFQPPAERAKAWVPAHPSILRLHTFPCQQRQPYRTEAGCAVVLKPSWLFIPFQRSSSLLSPLYCPCPARPPARAPWRLPRPPLANGLLLLLRLIIPHPNRAFLRPAQRHTVLQTHRSGFFPGGCSPDYTSAVITDSQGSPQPNVLGWLFDACL